MKRDLAAPVASVAVDIRQTAPFSSSAQEALLGLLRTANDAQRFVAQVIGREGITFQQYNVLRILRGAGSEGLPTLDIGERMLERQPGVTRIIDRLVRKGLVVRERGRHDRRRVWCRITADGLALLTRLDDPVHEADHEACAGLTEDQRTDLITLLDLMRVGLKRPTR